MLSIYKASAGSGKTFTLAREYIRLLLSASERDIRAHSHILAVTFTKKATAEMKDRILGELFLLATHPERSPYLDSFQEELHLSTEQIRTRAKARLYQILQDYTHLNVSTIDGFFQQIVRAFARELGLQATYTITLDTDEVIERAVDDLMFAANRSKCDETTGEWVKDFVLRNIKAGNSWNPKKDIHNISTNLLTEQLQAQLLSLHSILTQKDLLRSYRAELQKIIDKGDSEWKGLRQNKMTEEILEHRRDFYTASVILEHLDELGLLTDVSEQIRLTNANEGRLPISDVNLLLNRVIDGSDTPFIYEKTGTRLHHYMIDEFQDTSVLQWANFRPLVAEANDNGRDNLIVGDTKQSIYRFRNSDWHLLEGVSREIQPCVEPPMDTNFRSAETIVDFNNDIFRRYADYVEATPYNTLYQNAKRKDLSGYVRLQFFDAEPSKAEIMEMATEQMLPIIADAIRRGVKPGDIAILVRDGKEARMATQQLLAEGYEVQSAEGLLLSSNPAVETVIVLLSLSIHPEDEILQARLQLAMGERTITDSQHAALQAAHHLPLYEQVQTFIETLQLTSWPDAETYITSLLDVIYQYSENRIADTASFLEYWQRRCEKLTIPSSPSDKAIQVMTIHKSKGLEFDVVIIPYMTWSIAASSMDSRKLLWVRPTKAPFSTLPLVPVGNKAELSKSHFCEQYEQEIFNLKMDNLNLTYVAFTRAKRELYAFAQAPKVTSKGVAGIKTVGNLMYHLLEDEIVNNIYERRDKSGREVCYHQTEEKSEAEIRTAQYAYSEPGERLRLRTHDKQQQELNLQDFGTLMHDLLAEVERRGEENKAIERYIYIGRARTGDRERIREGFDSFYSLIDRAGHSDWFDGNHRVLREQDILAPDGGTYRPDRVMLTADGEAIIIDYKFGEHRRESYHKQVKRYMQLMTDMGYRASGYLVYVTLETIEKI